jgi:hypothetical protein
MFREEIRNKFLRALKETRDIKKLEIFINERTHWKKSSHFSSDINSVISLKTLQVLAFG